MSFAEKQDRHLAFIYACEPMRRRPSAEAEGLRYFRGSIGNRPGNDSCFHRAAESGRRDREKEDIDVTAHKPWF